MKRQLITNNLNHKALAFLDDFVAGEAKDDTVEGGLAVAVKGDETQPFYYGKLVATLRTGEIGLSKPSKDSKPVADAIRKEEGSANVRLSEVG